MGNRLISFIDKFHLLYDYQFGFRKHFSTSLALIDVLNLVQNENYKNNYVLAVFMDLRKAFDTVNLNILLEKLEHYGIRGVPLNWFKSFLLNRSQYTYVNSTQSCSLEIKCGIPQGTVLGPLRFILFIRDISNVFKK